MTGIIGKMMGKSTCELALKASYYNYSHKQRLQTSEITNAVYYWRINWDGQKPRAFVWLKNQVTSLLTKFTFPIKNYNSIKQKSQDVGYAAIFSFCCSEGGIGRAHCPFAQLPSPRFFPFSQSPTPPRFASARLFGALGTNKDGAHKTWLFSSRISSIWQG